MARPKASQSGSGVSLAAEPNKSGYRKTSSKIHSPEVLGISNVIILDSEDELEQTAIKPSPSKFGSSRDLGKAAFSMVGQKPMVPSSISAESRKMKDSRKRVLAVEDPSGGSMFDSKCTQASPSSTKRSTFRVPLDGNCPLSDTRTTVGPMVDLDARITATPASDIDMTEQSFSAKRKRKSGVKATLEVQSGTLEHAEQDNKENNGSDLQGGNGVISENVGKKRKKEAGTPMDPESSSRRSQSPSDFPAVGSVPSEGKIMSTCHQCRQKHGTSLAWCRDPHSKKVCTHKYCAKCLHNRYGETVAEVQDRDTWSCPRCRGICNCSLCMKKKGLAPTGGLAKKAKAAGYSSVADLLEKFPSMREDKYVREENVAVTSGFKDDSVVQPVDESKVFQTSEAEMRSKQVKEDLEATKGVGPVGDQSVPTVSEGGKKRKKRKKKNEFEASVSHVHVDYVQGQSGAAEPKKDALGEGSTKKKKKKQRKSSANVRVGEERENLAHDSGVETYEELAVEEEIVLPKGEPLLKVGALGFPPEAVGPALQILEFCSAFEKPLRLKRTKAQNILSEMLRGRTLRRGGQSDLVQLHVLLLSIILDDVDDDTNVTMSATSKNCWVYHLERHLAEQFCLSKKSAERQDREDVDDDSSVSSSTSGTKGLPLSLWPVLNEDMMDILKALRSGVDGYGNLSVTTRLQLLATLCDDTLTTKKMRDFLDKVITSHEVEQKENREELLALKKQAREVQGNNVKEVTAAKGDNSVPLVRDLVKVKREYTKLAEKEAQLTETAAKLCAPRCDALRTEPAAVHKSGSRFWRLKGAKNREVIVLQDISNLERHVPNESWIVFSENQEQEVVQCITNLNTRKKAPVRNTKRRRRRKAQLRVDDKDLTTKETEAPEISIIELSD